MLDLFLLHPFLSVFLLFIVLPTAYFTISVLLENRAIAKLGAFPPRVRAKLPFGADIVIRNIRHGNEDTDIDFWHWLFGWSPNQHSKTVEASFARDRFIFTADPENIKAILATQFDDFGKGKPFHEDWKHFLGDSIFTTDGDLWHASRQLIRPQFVKNRVTDLEIFEKHVAKMLSKIGGQREEVDVSALFYRFTLDSATDFLLGRSVDSLDQPDAPFASGFNEVQRIQYLISKSGPFNKFIPRKTFWAGLKVINSFVEPFIEQALRLSISDLSEKSNQSFLHALAATGTRDRKVIRDQVVAVLLAGRDTTAGALSFTFQELSANPEIVRKLRQQILDRVGPRRAPTYEDLKSMPYLQHVMNETLRLYPSVPFNVSLTLKAVWQTSADFWTRFGWRSRIPHFQRAAARMGLSQLVRATRASAFRGYVDAANIRSHCRRPQGYLYRLFAPHHATSCRSLPTRVCKLPQRLDLLSRAVGEMDPKSLDIHPIQRGPKDMRGTAICTDGDGIYHSQDNAEV